MSDARDFFESVRAAAIDAERIRRTLERMGAREQVRAQSYESRGGGSHGSDAMRATDERMDYEARIRQRQEADYALIDAACDVIYGSGQDGDGGIEAMVGPAAADCVWWRYCAAATWKEVADGCGMSRSWCQSVGVPTALDCADALGMGRMVSGRGLAEG